MTRYEQKLLKMDKFNLLIEPVDIYIAHDVFQCV